MPSGIDIAPIRVRMLEQQLQLGKELESRQGRGGALPVLEQGEVIPARVLENVGPGRYIVLIKDTPFIAESHISFAGGADITVRVERPAPDIRLALVTPLSEGPADVSSQAGTINEYLKWQRANPEGIRNLLTTLSEKLEPLKARNLQNSPETPNAQTAKNTQTAQNAPGTETARNSGIGRNPQTAQNTETARNHQTAQNPQSAVNAQNPVNARIAQNTQGAAGVQSTPGVQDTQNAQLVQNTPAVQNSPYAAKVQNPANAQAVPGTVQNVQDALLARLTPESATRLLALVKRLHYGGGTQDDNWVRNYARDLGLTVESDILKMLETGTDVIKELKDRPDLKRALAEVAQLAQSDIEAAPGIAERGSLKALAALVDSGIKNIEALQVANVALQDTQGPCAFQAPIVFEENRGTAHLFIEGDGPDGAGKKGTARKLLLILDLDRLGAMRVEASLAGGRIDCLFRCESSAARDLVAGGLGGLKESLEAAGCSVSTLGCIADPDVGRENQVCLNERIAMGESLSLFA